MTWEPGARRTDTSGRNAALWSPWIAGENPPGATHGHPRPSRLQRQGTARWRAVRAVTCCTMRCPRQAAALAPPCTQGTLPDRPADATGAYVPNSIPTASCTSTTHTPLPYHVLVLSLHVETGHQCYFLFFSLFIPGTQLLFILVFNPPPLPLIPSSSIRFSTIPTARRPRE